MFSRISRAALRAAAPRLVAGALAVTAAAAFVAPATAAAAPAAKLPPAGLPGTPKERSFVALKPDAVQRGLIGKIIARMEEKGYKLVACKMLTPTKAQAEGHYADLAGKPFFPKLVQFFSSGPIVAMVWEGQGVIKGTRYLLGATNPDAAPQGSIRSDYAVVTGRNIIHASDSAEAAAHEIGFWMTPEELNDYTLVNAEWVYE